MATIPSYTAVRAGIDFLTATLWNTTVINSFQFLLGQGANSKDYCTVRQTVGQSIPNGVGGGPVLPLTFDVVDTDHAGGFNLATPTRYYAKTAGNFRLSGAVSFAANATGVRQAVARVTHADASTTSYYAGAIQAASSFESVVPVSADFPMVVGDYVEACVFQSSGAALSTFVGNTVRPGSRVTFEWVAVA